MGRSGMLKDGTQAITATVNVAIDHNDNLCFIEEGHLKAIRRELEDRGFMMKNSSHIDYY